MLWVDRNADGLPQKDEFSFAEDNVRLADGAWGHMQNSLTYRFPAAIDDKAMIIEISRVLPRTASRTIQTSGRRSRTVARILI